MDEGAVPEDGLDDAGEGGDVAPGRQEPRPEDHAVYADAAE